MIGGLSVAAWALIAAIVVVPLVIEAAFLRAHWRPASRGRPDPTPDEGEA